MTDIFYTRNQLIALVVQFFLMICVAAAWEYLVGSFSLIVLGLLCLTTLLTAIYQNAEEHVYWDWGNIMRWTMIDCLGNLILLIPTTIIAMLLV